MLESGLMTRCVGRLTVGPNKGVIVRATYSSCLGPCGIIDVHPDADEHNALPEVLELVSHHTSFHTPNLTSSPVPCSYPASGCPPCSSPLLPQVGRVVDIKLITDKHTRKSRGLGYVEFSKVEEVISAVALTGNLLRGQPVMIKVRHVGMGCKPLCAAGPASHRGHLSSKTRAKHLCFQRALASPHRPRNCSSLQLM